MHTQLKDAPARAPVAPAPNARAPKADAKASAAGDGRFRDSLRQATAPARAKAEEPRADSPPSDAPPEATKGAANGAKPIPVETAAAGEEPVDAEPAEATGADDVSRETVDVTVAQTAAVAAAPVAPAPDAAAKQDAAEEGPSEPAQTAAAEEARPAAPTAATAIETNQPAATAGAGEEPAGESTQPQAAGALPKPEAAATADAEEDAPDAPVREKKPAAQAMGTAKLAPAEVAAAGQVEANRPASVDAPADAPEADTAGTRAMGGPMEVGTKANALPTPGAGGVRATPQLVEQTVDATVTAVRSATVGGRQQQAMTLRLDPPQLGTMRVNVQMEGGQLTATFSAGSDVTHRLLQQSLPQLKAGLEQAGIGVDRLNVQRVPTSGPTQEGQFHQPQQGHDGGGQPREQMQAAPARPAAARDPDPHLAQGRVRRGADKPGGLRDGGGSVMGSQVTPEARSPQAAACGLERDGLEHQCPDRASRYFRAPLLPRGAPPRARMRTKPLTCCRKKFFLNARLSGTFVSFYERRIAVVRFRAHKRAPPPEVRERHFNLLDTPPASRR